MKAYNIRQSLQLMTPKKTKSSPLGEPVPQEMLKMKVEPTTCMKKRKLRRNVAPKCGCFQQGEANLQKSSDPALTMCLGKRLHGRFFDLNAVILTRKLGSGVGWEGWRLRHKEWRLKGDSRSLQVGEYWRAAGRFMPGAGDPQFCEVSVLVIMLMIIDILSDFGNELSNSVNGWK